MWTGRTGGRAMVWLGASCLLALAACGSPGPAGNGKIGILAGENSWGTIVAQIGGDRVAVTSILSDPGADPHEYEANVHDAAVLSQATLVIENGLDYDGFLDKLLSANPRGTRIVLNVADIVGVHGDNANPHLWYSPQYVMAAARAFEAALASASAPDTSRFRANLRAFLLGEQRVVDVINRIKQKYRGTSVAYTERVPGYLLDAAGLRLGTPAAFSQSIEDGNDPSPADAAAFERALVDRAVKVLIYNAQVDDSTTKHLRELASSSAIPVVAMTETMPASEPDFQTWQLHQARALMAALGG